MSGSPEMSGSEMGEAEVDEDFTWKIELETALFEEAEIGSLRNIARGRPIPEHLRLDFWKVRVKWISLSRFGVDLSD